MTRSIASRFIASDAQVKRIYPVDLAFAEFRPWNDPAELDTVSKTRLRDVLDVLEEESIWTPDKLEGLAVTSEDHAFTITDNDGLDDALGQTLFVDVGSLFQDGDDDE